MNWPRQDLLKLFGIRHPILQAPMASAATPALAAAVSEAGGLGALGCAMLSPAQVAEQAKAIRAITPRPFNLNFFVFDWPKEDAAPGARMKEALDGMARNLGIAPSPVKPPVNPFDEAMLETVLRVKPKVASFHFGLLKKEWVSALHSAGILVLPSATNPQEAREHEAEGADAIIAQSYEAGGHQGCVDANIGDERLGGLALVPQIVDAVRVPVIAAGGIMDGRGIAAALALGASGVQMGTAFLNCPESGIAPAYRAALRKADGAQTRFSRAFSGRPARVIANDFVVKTTDADAAAAPFPKQYAYSRPFYATGEPAYLSFYAGQGVGLAREIPAGALIAELVRETEARLKAVSL